MTRPIRILGIDPGLRRTGWGVVEIAGNRLAFIGCGSVISNDRDDLATRLLAIHDGLTRVLDEFRPDEAAVEATFVNKDAQATLKLGQARGIAMVVPAKAGVPVAEYAANVVKKSIVGAGHGDKVQVRMMIGVLLPKADPASHDAADALAIAVTHAHHRQSLGAPGGGGAEGGCAMIGERIIFPPRWTGEGRVGVRGREACAFLAAADPHLLRFARLPPPSGGGQGGCAMIGKLKGIIDSYGEDSVILDVNGVGYLVHCSARTLQDLPRAGEPVTLSIETHVREDQIRLFGFTTDIEREWFKLLQTVQGVGTKVALAVLGTLKPADLASAIAMRDKAMVARTPGVGPKVAERIVTELKDKAPAYTQIDPALVRLSGALDEKRAPQPFADAVSALVNLGYAQPQAAAAIAAAARSAGEGAEVRTLIRLGLKELAK